jgi:Zn-dependent protease with chaperone function
LQHKLRGRRWPLWILEEETVQQSDATTARAQHTERAGWRLKLPASPLRLDDALLLEYRHPTELPMLVVSLVVFAVLLLGVAVLKHKTIVLGVVGVWLALIVTSLQAVTYNMLRGVEVTPTQFPAIFQIVQELRQRFQAPQTRVFVIRGFGVRAEVLGFRAPYAIVLPSLLLDSLEPDQLRFVVGRALGQIRFGHTRMDILLGGDESTLPVLFSWVARARNLVFAGYRRAQVLSADRAGILATDVGVAIETQIKLSVGNSQVREVRGDDLIDQAYQLTCGLSRLQAGLITLQSATPPLIYRLEAMVEWAGRPPPERSKQGLEVASKTVPLRAPQ